MTSLLQIGAAALMIALSYAIILAISTAAFVIVDRRYEIIPTKEEPDVQEPDDIR